MSTDFDMESFMHDHFYGEGLNHIITGPKGYGKTRTAVSIIQRLVTEVYLSCGRVICLTNIVFYHKTNSGRIVMQHPPGVIFVSSMAEVIRNTGEILRKYGVGKVTILLVLDEAQNYMQAESNFSKENLMILMLMANTRKFGMTTIFLTPTIINVVPKIRNLPLHPQKPGYCDVHWIKSKSRSKALVASQNLNVDPSHIIWIRSAPLMDGEDYKDEPEPMIMSYTQWANTKKEDLKPGQYGYSTRSLAGFEIGENINGVPFDLQDCIKHISKCDEDEVPFKLESYFEIWEKKQPKDKDEDVMDAIQQDRRTMARYVRRAKDKGLTWADLEYIFERPGSTLRSIMNTHGPQEASQVSQAASKTANCEEGGFARAIYIQPSEGENEGGERSTSQLVMAQSEEGE
jgi:Zonular occludens toxin (Zot).